MADGVLVLTGATATGKTALAVKLAERIGAEVISMDSRQVYRGMDIGTAKPTTGERRNIPHHGFERVAPDERYSAGRFAREARCWVADIQSRSKVPLVVGGTGFFLRALTHPLFEEPPLDHDERARLRARFQDMETATLRRWVRALDAASPIAETGGGRQRLARTIEIALLTGRSLSWWQRHASEQTAPLEPTIFVLERPPEELRARIDARVIAMVEAGLVEEVRALLDAGYTERDPGMSATGYAELIPHVRGERTLDEAINQTRAATRRYARRQRTWYRHQLPPGAHRLDATGPLDELVERIVELWKPTGR
ncbi:MAG: tRNA (adenosine(37)-N6)-dimethylallyltransferase MiaA [Longimicrobiales bacterium]